MIDKVISDGLIYNRIIDKIRMKVVILLLLVGVCLAQQVTYPIRCQ